MSDERVEHFAGATYTNHPGTFEDCPICSPLDLVSSGAWLFKDAVAPTAAEREAAERLETYYSDEVLVATLVAYVRRVRALVEGAEK